MHAQMTMGGLCDGNFSFRKTRSPLSVSSSVSTSFRRPALNRWSLNWASAVT